MQIQRTERQISIVTITGKILLINILNQTLLHDLLCERLGEMMFKYDSTFDYFERRKIEKQMDAIYALLGISLPEAQSLWNKIKG